MSTLICMQMLADWFPPLGLRVIARPLELRAITDEDLSALCQLASEGIHDPAWMPFSTPWTDGTPKEVGRSVAQYHWSNRGSFSKYAWTLEFGVWMRGELVGCQGFSTKDYVKTRADETGSWLGARHQGQGIGTAMRQAICAFLFDHLGAVEIISGAFLDNAASLAVSRKVGYRAEGIRQLQRRDRLADNQVLVLKPADLIRGEPIDVAGVEPFATFIGLR